MPENIKRGRRKRRQTKDRVLQARIPEQLDEELRDRAEQLGLSVSTVVRNVLLHTFELVEGVVTDSAQLARTIQGRESPPPPPPVALEAPDPDPSAPPVESPVIGWQEAVLNRNGICDTCNAILTIGERAGVGVPMQARPVLLCMECLTALGADSSDDSKGTPA
jgi:hypothetical protein